MRTDAGLFIETVDGDDADLPVADGRLDFEGAEEIGAPGEFSFGEKEGTGGMAGADDLVDVTGEVLEQSGGVVFNLEVDPRIYASPIWAPVIQVP